MGGVFPPRVLKNGGGKNSAPPSMGGKRHLWTAPVASRFSKSTKYDKLETRKSKHFLKIVKNLDSLIIFFILFAIFLLKPTEMKAESTFSNFGEPCACLDFDRFEVKIITFIVHFDAPQQCKTHIGQF